MDYQGFFYMYVENILLPWRFQIPKIFINLRYKVITEQEGFKTRKEQGVVTNLLRA